MLALRDAGLEGEQFEVAIVSETGVVHWQFRSGLGLGHKDHAVVTESGRILIIDAQPQIRRMLKTTFVAQGYEVWVARSGSEALELIRSAVFDVVLLDIDVSDVPGTAVCREVRKTIGDVVVVALSRRSGEKHKLAAFDAGAEDYITKPFQTEELLGRVRARLRGKRDWGSAASDRFETEDLIIDFGYRTITRKGNQVSKLHLPPKQWKVLRYLTSNRGKPLPHRSVMQAAWGPDYGEETMLLHALIARLRKKIEDDPAEPKHIVTVPWFGYRFD